MFIIFYYLENPKTTMHIHYTQRRAAPFGRKSVIKMDRVVVPAIIAHSRSELDGMLKQIRGRVNRVQLDVMDGGFVQNTSLMFDFKLPSNIQYEAHLMVNNPLSWVDENADKVDIAILHVEVLSNIPEAIEHVRERGLSIYLSQKPATSIDVVLPHLQNIDGAQVMTVEPGNYCGEFESEQLGKIDKIRKASKTLPIEVDGCMNPENLKLAKNHGANIFAVGSYIFKSGNIEEALTQLRRAAD